MHRQPLLQALEAYRHSWLKVSLDTFSDDPTTADKLIQFVQEQPNCFERYLEEGHVTASAYIINQDATSTLLTHHRKLNQWLQLGGHSDGDSNTFRVAMTEANEESGLKNLTVVPLEKFFFIKLSQPLLFDIDIHTIPERGKEKAHYHYDVRYLVFADTSESIQVTKESHDLKWIDILEAFTLANQVSMHRAFKKIFHLREKGFFSSL